MPNLHSIFLMKEQTIRSTSWGHHFIFLNTILAIIIGFGYVYASPHTESFIAFIYLLTSWLGQISFLGFLSFLIIFFPLTFIGNFKVYRILSAVIVFLLHCLLLIDAKIYLTIKVHLDWSVVSLMLRDLNFKTGLNFNFMYIAMILLIAIEIFFVKLATREVYRSEVRHNYFPSAIMAVVTVCFICSHSIFIWADATAYEKITNMRSVFPAHYPMTARDFLSNHGWIDNVNPNLDGMSTSSIKYPLQKISVKPPEHLQNIIAIYINGLSYVDLDMETTPNLLKLKLENLSYDNHYLPYSDFHDNLFGTWYGLPIQYENDFIDHSIDTVLVDEMQHQEYIMRTFTSGLTKDDLDYFKDLAGMNISRIRNLNLDKELISSVKSFIENSSNHNYAINIISNTLIQKSTLSAKQYKHYLKQLDELIGEFITQLQQSGLNSNTLIMISSMCGNQKYGAHSSFSKIKQQVPLIFIMANGNSIGVSKDLLSSAFDINPTLAVEILGVKSPCANYGIGDDLMTLQSRDFIPSTQGNFLVLIDKEKVSVYQRNGKVVYDKEGQLSEGKPNLENLIRALSMFNRFRQ